MHRFYLLSVLLIACANAFQLVKLKSISYRSSLRMLNDEYINEFQQKINKNDYVGAYSVIKRNPMMPLTFEDTRQLLNNMDNIINTSNVDSTTGNIDAKQTLEIVSYLYKRFDRQNTLKGFGCVNGIYPEKSTDITPTKLTQLTGLSIDALTPKQRKTYWWLIGGGLCLAEIFIGRNVGIDPVFSLIPATILLFGIDAIAYQGAYFESIYQKLFPEYRDKIIHHEAGHFLITYLLGVPIRGCVTNAFDARQKYPDIRGQAGTIYYDTKLADEIANSKVTRTSLDRMSVITMAGIAAEALKFDTAEGGIVDEQQLISFFTSIQPPWNLLRIQGQARWAVLQAILLIKEHEMSYKALVQALQEGKPIGDCICAIEANLPEVLPSEVRNQEQVMRSKVQENDAYIRYIQKMTWKVGGLEPLTPENSSKYDIGLDGFIKKEYTQDTAAAVNTVSSPADNEVAIDEGIKAFTDKIKILQQKASTGNLDDIYDDPSSGGVWLNGLNSLKNSNNISGVTGPDTSNSLQLPTPREGYEEGIKKLLAEENKPFDDISDADTESVKLIQSIYKDQKDSADGGVITAETMLASHRGYQMKRLENILVSYDKEIESIAERMKQLTNKVK